MSGFHFFLCAIIRAVFMLNTEHRTPLYVYAPSADI